MAFEDGRRLGCLGSCPGMRVLTMGPSRAVFWVFLVVVAWLVTGPLSGPGARRQAMVVPAHGHDDSDAQGNGYERHGCDGG